MHCSDSGLGIGSVFSRRRWSRIRIDNGTIAARSFAASLSLSVAVTVRSPMLRLIRLPSCGVAEAAKPDAAQTNSGNGCNCRLPLHAAFVRRTRRFHPVSSQSSLSGVIGSSIVTVTARGHFAVVLMSDQARGSLIIAVMRGIAAAVRYRAARRSVSRNTGPTLVWACRDARMQVRHVLHAGLSLPLAELVQETGTNSQATFHSSERTRSDSWSTPPLFSTHQCVLI